jgi:hypothetical protein
MKYRLNLILALLSIGLVSMTCQKEPSYTLEIKEGTRIVHNLKPKIDNARTSLQQILQIGELEPEDENYLFNQPISVTEDQEGNVFVLDGKEGCIKKFSAEGKFLTQFGRLGQGPGEFQYPLQIDCRSGRLLVSTMSAQFHLYDLNGAYLKSFRLPQYEGLFMKLMDSDSVVGFSMGMRNNNSSEDKTLKIFDTDGNVKHEFGEPFLVDKAQSSWIANFANITVDAKNNIYMAFIHQNRIEKYSDAEKLLLKISRELPFEPEFKYAMEKMEIGGRVREIERERFSQFSRGIGVDNEGRIWVLAFKSEVPRDFGREGFIPHKYLHFEVYDEEGLLLARVSFPKEVEQFDNMTMDGNHIYFVDPIKKACVYKYKVIWRD